jgi:hypothetical protein
VFNIVVALWSTDKAALLTGFKGMWGLCGEM